MGTNVYLVTDAVFDYDVFSDTLNVITPVSVMTKMQHFCKISSAGNNGVNVTIHVPNLFIDKEVRSVPILLESMSKKIDTEWFLISESGQIRGIHSMIK